MAKKNPTTTKEIWKNIPGYVGYECSNRGRIKSFWFQKRRTGHRRGFMSVLCNNSRILKESTAGSKKCKYALVVLKTKKGNKGLLVHRLVLLTFAGNPKKRQQCRHLDGNNFNNNFCNLCWGTAAENAID